MTNTNNVAADRCAKYDAAEIKRILLSQLDRLGFDLAALKGKRAVIKPNLVMRCDSSRGATTHPAVVEAAALILREAGADVTIAESSGGLYSESLLRPLYRACGVEEAAERAGVKLNFDVTSGHFPAPEGISCKSFGIITPVLEADYIFNLCKLKTHTLAVVSASAKNLFGTVPGISKFELHARFKRPDEFFSMICDLASALCEAKTVVHIADAVTGMEGNGPTGGSPRDIGCILSSLNPFALDLACSAVIGFEGEVPLTKEAVKRGLCPTSSDGLTVLGEPLDELKVRDFRPPDTQRGKKFGLIPDFLSPRPVIARDRCVGCGECCRNCPVKAIDMTDYSDGRKKAFIRRADCITCYCCQELCAFKAVDIRKNFIYSILR